MTIEDAILELESMKRLYAYVRKNDGEKEAVEMAIASLRAQQEAEKNDPLTLDELREMDGEPVWVIRGLGKDRWWIANDLTNGYRAVFSSDPYYPRTSYYGMKGDGAHGLDRFGWIAYRRPPEKEA